MRPFAANAAYRDRVLLVLLLACVASVLPWAFTPTIDLKGGLHLESVATGWSSVRADKVVPTVALKLRNASDQRLVVLQLIVRFRSADEVDEWGYSFRTVTGSAGLGPGAETDTLVIKAPFGYVGAGADRLVANFAEAKVELFAKYAAARWTPVGEYRIARGLIDR